jgi:hypothetical protein
MEIDITRATIAIIRTEQQRRLARIKEECSDDADIARDLMLFGDEPFLNDLSLTLLLALSHRVERELVIYYTLASGADKLTTFREYKEAVQRMDSGIGKNRAVEWNSLTKKLGLRTCIGHERMEVLRLLANSYKHSPLMQPSKKLLKKLNIDSNTNLAPLPESQLVCEKLSEFIKAEHKTYWDIAERFVEIAEGYLADVRRQNPSAKKRNFLISYDLPDLAW